ncbi:MAG: hypothetical protein IJ104_03915 [Methanobrevibacter sp.]|nr:hypothetical protein [Methanobrevibacter sp.]
MIKGEIKYLIKTELKKASKNPEQIRIDEKNEETRKQLKMIDELFESEEIKSEITKNKIIQITVISIKDIIKSKVINKREKIDKEEIESIIKTELIEAIKEQREIRIEEKKEINMKRIAEMNSKKIEKNENINGGYCSFSCRHYCEEFFDDRGGIVGDFDSEGYVEYYCALGHSLGGFCEYYE